jgi:GT2 family glycosyltransferase
MNGGSAVRGGGVILRDVAVVCPVFNEARSLAEFLDALAGMSALPEELIIVDGGSTDGSAALVERHAASHRLAQEVRVIVDPSCQRRVHEGAIARARNLGVRSARASVLAFTDAGCRVDPRWLEAITDPLRSSPDTAAAGGWYVPDARTWFERCVATAWFLPADVLRSESFVPSARSLAVRRSAWNRVGGFPEETYTAEDTQFVRLLRGAGFSITYVPEALVSWRVRQSLSSFLTMVVGYGEGDGRMGILRLNVLKNSVRLLAVAVPLVLVLFHDPAWAAVAAVMLAVMPFLRSPARALHPSNLIRFPVLGLLKLAADAAYIWGYSRGRGLRVPRTVPSGRTTAS